MLGALDEADYEQIDREIEIDLLHDIEQIVENDQVEDAADAVVDQVIAETYRDNDEILVGDVTQQQQHVDDDDEPMVDYDDEDDELAREIREAEAKIEELKAKKTTTPAPPSSHDEQQHHHQEEEVEEYEQRMEFDEPEPTFEIIDGLETIYSGPSSSWAEQEVPGANRRAVPPGYARQNINDIWLVSRRRSREIVARFDHVHRFYHLPGPEYNGMPVRQWRHRYIEGNQTSQSISDTVSLIKY